MLSFRDYNFELIRDFTESQLLVHIELFEDIQRENDFGDTGIETLIKNYLVLLHRIQEEHQKIGQEDFRLSAQEVFLYDLCTETARLCYKHSYHTSASTSNDWEEEF
ncbi:MAG: hypothetical protein ACRCWI_05370 [Brevinema sp.]